MATKDIVISLKTTFDGAGVSQAVRDLDKAAASSKLVDAALSGMDSTALKAQRSANELALSQQHAAESSNALAKAAQSVEAALAATINPATQGKAANDAYAKSLADAANVARQFRTDMDALAATQQRNVQLADQQAAAADRAAAAAKRQADAQFKAQLKTFNATAIGGVESGVARTVERGGLGRAVDSLAQNYAYSGAPGSSLAFGLPVPVIAGVAAAGAGIYAIQQASTLDSKVRQLLGGTTGDASQVDPYTRGLLNIARSPGLGVNASDLATDAYPILSSFSNASTPDALAALKTGTQAAVGVNADPATYIAGVIKSLQAYGAPLSQFGQFSDLSVAAIRAGSADPTGLAAGFGTFANTAAGLGVAPRDAEAAFANSTLTSRDAQQSAFDFNSFLQVFSRRATATQSRVSGDLGLSLGPDALSKATLPGYLAKFQSETAGLTDAQRERVGYSLTNNVAAAAFLSSNTGARFGSYQATQATFDKAGGSSAAAFNTVAGGADQQGAAALATFNADVTEAGKNLLPLKSAAALAAAGMLTLADTGIPKLTTAIQDFAVQANSGMDGFVAYVNNLKSPTQVPGDIAHGLSNVAAAAGSGIGGFLGGIGNSVDAGVSGAASGVGGGASGIAALIGSGKAYYDRAANRAGEYTTQSPKQPPPTTAASGSFGPGGDYYAPPNIASIFHFGRGYVAPATLPPDSTASDAAQQARAQAAAATANTQANLDRIHKNATSAGALSQAITDQQNVARGQAALQDSLAGPHGAAAARGIPGNAVLIGARDALSALGNVLTPPHLNIDKRGDNQNAFALAQLTVDPAAARKYGDALIRDELASTDSASAKALLVAQIQNEIKAVQASATATAAATAARVQALAVQTSNEALRGATITYNQDTGNNAPLSVLNRDSAAIRGRADAASRRNDVGANAYLLPNDLRQNALDQAGRDKTNATNDTVNRTQDAISAASQQLQAAQFNRSSSAKIDAAAEKQYQATIAYDRTITSPRRRDVADRNALLTRNTTDRSGLLDESTRVLGQDQARITYDANHGIPTVGDVKQLGIDEKKYASATGKTALDIANELFALLPHAIPRLAPTFAPSALDPGVEATRGSAAFRTGVYARDTQNEEIALLRQQVSYQQQTINHQDQELRESRQQTALLQRLVNHGEKPTPKSSVQVGAGRGKN